MLAWYDGQSYRLVGLPERCLGPMVLQGAGPGGAGSCGYRYDGTWRANKSVVVDVEQSRLWDGKDIARRSCSEGDPKVASKLGDVMAIKPSMMSVARFLAAFADSSARATSICNRISLRTRRSSAARLRACCCLVSATAARTLSRLTRLRSFASKVVGSTALDGHSAAYRSPTSAPE